MKFTTFLLLIIIPAWLGFSVTVAGIFINTWQYWFIIAPICITTSYIWSSIKTTKKETKWQLLI